MTAVTPGQTGNQYNLVSQMRRQTGSTFKAIVLATAISEGINPDTTYYRLGAVHYRCKTGPLSSPSRGRVHTYDNTYVGFTSITRATLRSDNSVFAQPHARRRPEQGARMARGSASARRSVSSRRSPRWGSER